MHWILMVWRYSESDTGAESHLKSHYTLHVLVATWEQVRCGFKALVQVR